jgi:hypothetical protein
VFYHFFQHIFHCSHPYISLLPPVYFIAYLGQCFTCVIPAQAYISLLPGLYSIAYPGFYVIAPTYIFYCLPRAMFELCFTCVILPQAYILLLIWASISLLLPIYFIAYLGRCFTCVIPPQAYISLLI